MRQYVTFALIIVIHLSFAMAKASGFPFLLKQSEFQQITQAEQVKYLALVFQTLGDAEQSKKMQSSCVVGGDVFPKTGNSCAKKHNCLKNEVPCAGYLGGGQDCVSLTSKEATTFQCLSLHPIDSKSAHLFSDTEAGDIYRRLAKGIADYCGVNPKANSCSDLEKETQSYRHRFEPKIPKTSLFNLLRFLFTEAHASAPCTYDKQTQQFTGQDGQIIEFHFAIHAAPNTVSEYWDATSDPSVSLREPARKLIEANSGNNENMRQHTLDMYKKLKNGELTWVGFEGSESLKAMRGGTKAYMEDIQYTEKELRSSGLSPNEVQLALIDIYGSAYAYYLWYKEQPDSAAAMEKVKLIGVDNGRNPKVDELDEKVNKLSAQSSEKFNELTSAPYTPENHAFMMKFYKMKPTPANLEALLKSPEAAAAKPEARKLVSDYLQLTRDIARLRKERSEAEAQEFKVRDYSMAQDTYKALVENGQGLATLGSAHEKGTIEYLVQACKNYRPSKPSSGSGSGKSTGSKSKSGSVDSSN